MATIRKRRGKWEAQIRRSGLRAVSKSFNVRKDAETWARHVETQADKGSLPPSLKALQRLTLGDLVIRYRDTVTSTKRSGPIERIVLDAFCAHPIAVKCLSELRTEDFATYRDERLKVIKPASLKRQLVPIRHMFEVARDEWGLPIGENPVAKLRLHDADQRRERRLQGGELNRLIEASRRCRNRLILPIVQLALETGMRRGEILKIRTVHIDAQRRTLLIPESKNGRSRVIPLTDDALALLPAGSADRQIRVFPISANAFRLAWERLRRRAGIPDLHFHDLRHEAISRFFEAGLTAPEVASISGHRDMRMQNRLQYWV
jgi:integrase